MKKFQKFFFLIPMLSLLLLWSACSSGNSSGGSDKPEPVFYTLTVSKTGSGSGTVLSSGTIECGDICTESHSSGTSVSLSAVAESDSVFVGWSGACSGTDDCNIVMDENKSVTAIFDHQDFTLSVALSGEGDGTVTSAPAGIDCGVDCNETYVVGTNVELTATPNVGSVFSGWSGSCSGTGTCVLSMDAVKSVTANFGIQMIPLTVTLSGNATGIITSSPPGITCGDICEALFPYNTQVTLTAVPDSGALFDGFSGDCASVTSACTFTLTTSSGVKGTFNTSTPTASGNQLKLDGIDDVAVHQESANPPSSALDLSTFTIEAWIYPLANRDMIVAADSAYYLMLKAQTSTLPLRMEFAVMTSTGFPALKSYSGEINPLQLHQWNHVVGMVNNSSRELRVAVNGELSIAQSMGGDVSSSTPQTFSIGNSYPEFLGDYPFIGRIDDVRLSSILRYTEGFLPLSLLDADGATVGLWHFDESENNTTFIDSSGNNHHLFGLNGSNIIVGSREVQGSENSLFYSLKKMTLSQTAGPIIIEDFNNDGINDFAITGVYAVANDKVAIVLGTGEGNFSTPVYYTSGMNGAHPSIATGDFDNNGVADLVIANSQDANVSVLLGTGTGSFGTATQYAVGTSPQSVAVGDLNNDNKTDLVVVNVLDNNISVLLGDGAGSFGNASNFIVGNSPRSVVLGDFNLDNKVDIAVTNYEDNNIAVLLGTGTGSFGGISNFSVGVGPMQASSGDFNKDGKLDLAVVNFSSANVSVLLGTGSGIFNSAVNYSIPIGGLAYLVTDDMNSDGNLDIAVASGGGNSRFCVCLGNGSGGFSEPIIFGTGNNPLSLATGDLNGDAKADLVVGISFSDIHMLMSR